MDKATALSAIDSWPLDQQVEFVQEVWDRIVDAGWQPELTDELKAELDRRLDAHAADPSGVVSWESIVEYVRRAR